MECTCQWVIEGQEQVHCTSACTADSATEYPVTDAY